MSYYVVVSGEKQVELASNTGWKEVKDYVEEHLSARSFPELNHFCGYGWSQNITDLLQELRELPTIKVPTVGTVLLGLKETLEVNPEASSIFVTDGIGPLEPTNETAG